MDNKTTEKKSQGKLPRKKPKQYGKCTHLHMQEKYLTKIPKVNSPKDVMVFYLYNNEITEIGNLDGFLNLTSLYLQCNKIQKIENLRHLKHLKKLYIGHNQIEVIEGLEGLESLEELHVEKQEISEGIPLCFDPRTILSLAGSLQVLNVSHNRLPSLSHLALLRNLAVVDASHNDLEDIKDVCQTVGQWWFLKEAKFLGNAIAKKHRYRENIIASANHLEILDDKKISEVTRLFIQRFEEGKIIYGSKQSINLADMVPGLPKNYPPPLQKAVSASLLKESKCLCSLTEDLSTFDEKDAVYIPWNALPPRRPFANHHKALRGHKLEYAKNISEKSSKRVSINTFPRIIDI